MPDEKSEKPEKQAGKTTGEKSTKDGRDDAGKKAAKRLRNRPQPVEATAWTNAELKPPRRQEARASATAAPRRPNSVGRAAEGHDRRRRARFRRPKSRMPAPLVGADGDVGSAPVREDRRPRRGLGVADRRARRARPLGHARAASLSTGAVDGRRAAPDAGCAWAIACSRSLLRAPSVGRGDASCSSTCPSSSIAKGSTAPPPATIRTTPLRFAVFSRAALEYPRLREQRPSIIHAHDWQAGLVPVYQKMHLSADPFVGGVPAVFTIHNLAFQGVFPAVDAARDRARLRSARRAGPRVLGQHQLPEGRDQLQREDHDRQPRLREGDRPARARLRLRRRPRAARPTSSASSTASTPRAGPRRPTRSCRRRSAPTTRREARRQARAAPASACRSTTPRSRGRSSASSRA